MLGQNFPDKPRDYVTDDAKILSNSELSELNSTLRSFEDSTSIQLFVYTANSLNGNDMSDLCQQIFHTWKIGHKKTSNGVLIAIFLNDHKFRIHTGYGMEGVLPDLRTKKIQDEIMRPRFKENNYFMGLVEGVQKIIFYSKHEFDPVSEEVEKEGLSAVGIVLIFVYSIQAILFIIVCIILYKDKDILPGKRTTLIVFSSVLLCVPFVGILGLIIVMAVAYMQRKGGGSSTYSGSSYDSWESTSVSSSSSSDYSSSSSSDSSFDGGGGGDSGGGGSDSDW